MKFGRVGMHPSTTRLVSFAKRHRGAAAVVNAIARSRAQKLFSLFHGLLPDGGKILDIGAGSGHITEAVCEAGHEVVPLDIEDLRFVDLPLVLANGAHLPFSDASFDAVLLLTVLHHAPHGMQPEILREAARVMRPHGRIVILEDTYRTVIERAQTIFLDTVLNAEFFGHPHANRSLEEWKVLIDRLGLRPVHVEELIVRYGIFRIRHAVLAFELR